MKLGRLLCDPWGSAKLAIHVEDSHVTFRPRLVTIQPVPYDVQGWNHPLCRRDGCASQIRDDKSHRVGIDSILSRHSHRLWVGGAS